MMETGGLEDVPLWNATHKVTEHLVPACSEEEHVIQYMSSSESFNLRLDLDLFMTCFHSLEQVEALDFKYDEYCWAITSKAQCGDLTHGAKKGVFGAISM